MLELSATDPIIKTYLKDLQHLKDQSVVHELGLKGPFQNLLDKAAKKRGWTLVAELSTYSGGKRVVPDGTVRDEFRLARGWWEAKDTSDKLPSEIQKKLKAGYPTRNTIFEDTQIAVAVRARMDNRSISSQGRVRPEPRRRSWLHRAAGGSGGARKCRDRPDRKKSPGLPF